MSLDPCDEYDALLRAARALVEWEEGVGGAGFPAVEAPPLPDVSVEPTVTPPAPVESAVPRREPATTAVRERPAPASAQREGAPSKAARLALLASEAAACTACDLHRERQKSVFSRGSIDAELMFVGEGPGQQEDLQGEPFVGPAGQLLDRMIAAMGYARDEVYICNVVKCRPPGNRAPSPAEAGACRDFLDGQIDAVRPRLIIALGRSAAERLALVPESGRWRGEFGEYRGITTLATFHPAYLLRSPEQKKVVWADLKRALQFLGKSPPTASR